MNKKILIAIAVLAIAGLGIYLLFLSKPAQSPSQETNQPSDTTAQKPPASSGLVAVDIKGFAFVGKTTTISAGTKVIWKNYDAAPHTVTENTGLFDSKTLLKDQSFSYTFTQPGIYRYHCGIHPEMQGEIFVK